MRNLYLALYCEGPTDERFLPILIERLIFELVEQRRGESIEIYPFFFVNKQKFRVTGNAERILEAAKQCREQTILFVQFDVDSQSLEEARQTRFEPGLNKINAVPLTERLCRHLVPVIPDRMIETWILADWKSVLKEPERKMSKVELAELRNQLKSRGCNLPAQPHQAVADRTPKQTLEHIIKIVRGQQSAALGDLHENAAKCIDLKILRKLKAFQQFESELIAKLAELRIIDG